MVLSKKNKRTKFSNERAKKTLSVLQSQRKNKTKQKKATTTKKKTTTKKTQQKIPNFVKALLIACEHHTQHNS